MLLPAQSKFNDVQNIFRFYLTKSHSMFLLSLANFIDFCRDIKLVKARSAAEEEEERQKSHNPLLRELYVCVGDVGAGDVCVGEVL